MTLLNQYPRKNPKKHKIPNGNKSKNKQMSSINQINNTSIVTTVKD